jgi:ABC-type nitrate/sulfonate/bicarbonate transport system permease component
VVALWQLVSLLGLFSAAVLPSPAQVLAAWWQWLFGSGGGLYDGTWLRSALTSAGRVLQGFVIASALGVVLGIMIGYFRAVYTVLDPLVQFFRPIPAVAWVPLAAAFFGFTHNATIFLISYGAFFPIVLNSAAGVLRSQKTYIQVGRMIGANRYQMLRYIVLPAAMPSVFTGLRLGIGTAWILVIVGEMIAVRTGLGYSLLNAYTVFRYDIVIAAMASFGLLGLLSDRLVLLLERRVLRWREGYDVAST